MQIGYNKISCWKKNSVSHIVQNKAPKNVSYLEVD